VTDTVHFKEVQRFTQPWLWGFVLATLVFVVAMFGWALYQQLALGEPWGNKPLSDLGLILASCGAIGVSLGIVILFLVLRLEVEVRDEGVGVSFRPFSRRLIAFSEIRKCSARTFQPLRNYGGWGLRTNFRSNAYTVRGNEGVWLEFNDAKPVLVGSQRAAELADVINAVRQRHAQ
jgi:hypothetical protein